MGRILIDTSILVEADRGRLDLAARLRAAAEEEFVIGAITVSEILHSLHRARTAEQRSRRETFIEYLLRNFEVMPFDVEEARVHARLGAELAAAGVTIGAHDLILAATALAVGASLATRDERSFSRVPGLAVLRW